MISMALLLCCAAMMEVENTTTQHAADFDYDRSASLEVKIRSTSLRSGVAVVDLDFVSPRGGRVPAYLILPPGKGPFPAIIYGHWGNPQHRGQTFNRSEFLDEAVVLASAGVVSLLPDAPSARLGFKEDPDPFSSQDTEVLAQQVVDVRRGVDLLTARRDVDPDGHSFDAAVGGVLRGIEPRIRALVLMAGAFSVRDLLMSDEPRMIELRKYGEERVRQYLDKFDWADPVHYVSRPGRAPVLVQVATHDEFGSEANFRHQAELVAEPRTINWYDANHALNAQARTDRCEWLRNKLGLKQSALEARGGTRRH